MAATQGYFSGSIDQEITQYISRYEPGSDQGLSRIQNPVLILPVKLLLLGSEETVIISKKKVTLKQQNIPLEMAT